MMKLSGYSDRLRIRLPEIYHIGQLVALADGFAAKFGIRQRGPRILGQRRLPGE